MFKTKGITCGYFRGPRLDEEGGVTEDIGMCVDEDGHSTACRVYLDASAGCPTYTEQLIDQLDPDVWGIGLIEALYRYNSAFKEEETNGII